jgi:hypothetical protein
MVSYTLEWNFLWCDAVIIQMLTSRSCTVVDILLSFTWFIIEEIQNHMNIILKIYCLQYRNMKFWYINGSGMRRNNPIAGLGLPFFRSQQMWRFERREVVRPSPYPQLGGPSLRIYDPRRQHGSSIGDLGSPSSRNDKNCEPVTGSI